MKRAIPARRDSGATRAAEPPGLASRRLALSIVMRSLQRSGSLEDQFDDAARLEPRDAALARAIATTTFRRFGSIWAALEARLDRGMPEDLRAGALLMIGAAQILFMDVPDRAAVDTAVELARAEPSLAHLSGLANAVLRRISRERDAALLAVADPLVDLPPWLATRWREVYGADIAAAIANAHRGGAAVDLTARSDAHRWAATLGGELLPTGSVRLPERLDIPSLPGFAEGAWWVQDAAAAIPAQLLPLGPGRRAADLCAAPGGKTAQLAATGAEVTAVDRSASRLRRLADNMRRLNLSVGVITADALAFEAEPFDAVLLDAPCTATGTIRRHPDVAWTKTEADLASLVDLQRRLLDRAVDLTRPGGSVVYCVCSLEREEGEEQIAALLGRRSDVALSPIEKDELPGLDGLLDADGRLRTRPDLWPRLDAVRPGLDGFFAARLKRVAP